MNDKYLGCIATTALTPAKAFRPTSSGSKEAIDIAKIMAIPVLKIRAPRLKNNDTPF